MAIPALTTQSYSQNGVDDFPDTNFSASLITALFPSAPPSASNKKTTAFASPFLNYYEQINRPEE
jgi:hypothetical protein